MGEPTWGSDVSFVMWKSFFCIIKSAFGEEKKIVTINMFKRKWAEGGREHDQISIYKL